MSVFSHAVQPKRYPRRVDAASLWGRLETDWWPGFFADSYIPFYLTAHTEKCECREWPFIAKRSLLACRLIAAPLNVADQKNKKNKKRNTHHTSPNHHEQNRAIRVPPADQSLSLHNDPKRILAVPILTRGTLRAQKPKWGIYSCNKSAGSVMHIRRETYACYYLLSRQRDSRVAPFSAPVTKMDICWNAYSSIDQHFTTFCI